MGGGTVARLTGAQRDPFFSTFQQSTLIARATFPERTRLETIFRTVGARTPFEIPSNANASVTPR
jgi:hypothetical protein